LSGGTITRGSGVSEVFGNLNLTQASFLDLGSDLRSTINNSSLFTSTNGGIASTSWNQTTSTFTITAIPEPSTWVAAIGLLALHRDVVYSPHRMKVEEPAAGYPVRIPVAPEVARRAMEFARQFPGCFWFRDEEAQVRYHDDVELVVKHLRAYGDKTAWEAAKELRRCL
jgi:hypothetical protein